MLFVGVSVAFYCLRCVTWAVAIVNCVFAICYRCAGQARWIVGVAFFVVFRIFARSHTAACVRARAFSHSLCIPIIHLFCIQFACGEPAAPFCLFYLNAYTFCFCLLLYSIGCWVVERTLGPVCMNTKAQRRKKRREEKKHREEELKYRIYCNQLCGGHRARTFTMTIHNPFDFNETKRLNIVSTPTTNKKCFKYFSIPKKREINNQQW